MRIALISDVHGNYPALLAVFERIRKENCDLVISLGDVAGYYCMINECIEFLKENEAVNILGNHDKYLFSGVECRRSTSANVCIEFQRNVITFENLEWLRGSIREYRNSHYWFVHGGWNDPLEEYVGSFDFSGMSDCGAKLFASGHTHIQKVQQNGCLTYVNPGSVGQPRDGDPRAAFVIINEAGDVSLCREEYDIDDIAFAMKANGFGSRFYEGLYCGTGIQQFGSGDVSV
ncbi:MAG: metallophosphoesterase family protein [Negativicutes bacterium]|nr:metallophosphoesterase family protein [Negativicutes bacterium]